MEYMGPARWRRRWEGTVTVEEAIRRLRLYPQSYQFIKRDSDCDTPEYTAYRTLGSMSVAARMHAVILSDRGDLIEDKD